MGFLLLLGVGWFCFFFLIKTCPELFTLECYSCMSCLIVSCPLVSRVLSLRNSLLWNLSLFLYALFSAGAHAGMLGQQGQICNAWNQIGFTRQRTPNFKQENTSSFHFCLFEVQFFEWPCYFYFLNIFRVCNYFATFDMSSDFGWCLPKNY